MTASGGGGAIRLVGTAHISSESVEEVERAIDEARPDVVAVELDESRYRQLKGEAPDDLDPRDLLKGNTVFQFLAYWLLSYVQTRLGERFDIEPGADMKAAIDAAESHNIDVALVDRDIQTTIQRFWTRLTFLEKLRLVWQLLLAMGGFDPGDAGIEMEELTDTDVVTAMIEEFRRFSPGGAEALIDERDAYIAHRLHSLAESGVDVVAVVGAGHVEGIEKYLANPLELPPISELEERASTRWITPFKAIGYLITVGFLAFFVLLALGIGSDQQGFLIKVLAAWFLFNGVFAFGLAKLGGAHWSSATVGGLVAWLTSVNPLLAPGWFAGYVELKYTTVSVGDIGTLNEILDDHESPMGDVFRRMIDVPLFRLIMVVALTNVGSLIASVLFPVLVIPWLAPEIGGVSAVTDAIIRGAEVGLQLVLGAIG